jgi:hypothetical protein
MPPTYINVGFVAGNSTEKGGVTSIEMVPYPGSRPGTCRSGTRKYILLSVIFPRVVPLPFEVCFCFLGEPAGIAG